jgi:hypothetical protein
VIGRNAQNLRVTCARTGGARLKDPRPRPFTGSMIEPTQAVSAATGTDGASATKATAVKSTKDFAGELAKAATAADPTAKAAARPDGEQTKKIAGHPYSRIENGSDKGLFLNQVAGNPRQGVAFRMVERNNHVFHVYGTGKDKVIIGMTPHAAADTTPNATTTGGAPSAAPAKTSS